MNKREFKESASTTSRRKTENKPLPPPVPQRNSLEYIDPKPHVWNIEDGLWSVCLQKLFYGFQKNE